MLETSGSDHAAVGLAVAPEDGDTAERVMRSARDALAKALEQGGGIQRTGIPLEFDAATPSPHSDASRVVIDESHAPPGRTRRS